ncbi:MAG: SDR family NAD(P)-dependent oxidoreductase [Catenulispora sp.]|nr:SDR family NAD(P)-dependent oxidoreductase [Catenulispora sp.]
MGRFAGKTALVTGGSRGLGLLIAERLGRRGCRVMICARDADELETAGRRLRAAGVDAETVVCDVTDPGAGKHLVDTVTSRFGQLDVLVNNAGVIQVGPLKALTGPDFDNAWQTMFAGPLRLILAALPQMRARRSGTIVNIASIGGRIPVPHLLPYVAAKHAMAGFSSGLRAELAADGISVTTVFPGLMRTGSHRAATFSGRPDQEFAWFSALAGMPLVSGSADRAARAIVRAAEHRRPELVFTPAAKLGSRLYALAPATATRVLGLTSRLLPAATETPGHNVPGAAIANRQSPLLAGATALNERAARQNNEPLG